MFMIWLHKVKLVKFSGNKILLFIKLTSSYLIMLHILLIGYISGMKMLLPENVERKDNKQFEEVTIPVSSQAPLSVGNNLIPISSLDNVSIRNIKKIFFISQRFNNFFIF